MNCTEQFHEVYRLFGPKNFNEIKQNEIPNDALKFLASITNIDRELLSKELKSFIKSFN